METKLRLRTADYVDTHTYRFDFLSVFTPHQPCAVFSFLCYNVHALGNGRRTVLKKYCFIFNDPTGEFEKEITETFQRGYAYDRDLIYDIYGRYLLSGGLDMRSVPFFYGEPVDRDF